MSKEPKEKAPKRPTVEVDLGCPGCKAKLHVKVYKRRISEPVEPEYQISAEVELGVQGHLPGVEKPAGPKADVSQPAPPSKKGKLKSAHKDAAT